MRLLVRDPRLATELGNHPSIDRDDQRIPVRRGMRMQKKFTDLARARVRALMIAGPIATP